MEKRKIILVGGGGHCKSCIDVIEREDKFTIAGILDKESLTGEKILGYPILGSDQLIEEFANENYCFLITVGQIKSSAIREKIYKTIKKVGGELPVVISPHAIVSKSATLEEGTIVMHSAIVNAAATIGKCCILNTGSLVEHDCKIGNFCHISTTSTINGSVVIGDSCFVGSKAVINNNLNIKGSVIVPSGSRVAVNIDAIGVFKNT
ncbi:NeuD/PglB/VioB family sugar acetyltransferase [Ulvibacter litoralis]|uniref:Sugar O-acyltransferase, sialic acid O-acetyltransferase NeuD family n=1 Tax=Ulvibacter litoralis TaxID=227084 RepID=A0A1G7HMZ0_9FLAO|nr:NeuD/PglB/VioB family sugar acetyltransferase [Ulvibacter litoralis]GHC58423.1 acetyltransferase [Ulvibacter litoralis]SDF01812.1 sugar O-acyltransferase, sialic acid O-acetyltransferase NeuD family [Ulvibacter litoralis]